MRNGIGCLLISVFALPIGACDGSPPVAVERFAAPDELFNIVASNIAKDPSLGKVLEIDHSRLAAEKGSHMPPARVLIFGDRALQSALLEQNQLVGLDLPLRLLAYEEQSHGTSRLIYNDYDYLASRFNLNPDSGTRPLFERTMKSALKGIAPEKLASFRQNEMQPDGIVTLHSPFGFEETYRRVMDAIDSQSDAVLFGTIDFQVQARKSGADIRATRLILFGAPAPGGKAMRDAPTLGLDAFCQKFLVWQDDQQEVHLSYNDLLLAAERQGVGKNIALRVVDFRLGRTFGGVLSE